MIYYLSYMELWHFMNDLFDSIAAVLRDGGIENYQNEARWIIGESPDPAVAVERAKRRAAGEPLQYLLGTAPFRYLTLKVDRRVLIPRPETELLAQWLIDQAPAGASILELGCGSGAVSIAVATERPDLTVTAVDISTDALDLARINAAECGAGRIEFIHSDLFSALSGRKFDFIGANLPYVTEEEYRELAAEVRDFEPQIALTAPMNGLAVILRAVKDLPQFLNPGGGAIFELSPHQAAAVASALTGAGLSSGIIRDLCDRERFVTGIMP